MKPAIDLTPYFLNVDLDIESSVPLRLLVREFGKRVSVMYSGRMNGRYCLFVEIASMHKTPEKTIHALCALIESLSPGGRRLWNSAKRREFDIGFEVRVSWNRANRFSIDGVTLQRVTEIGASVAATFYEDGETHRQSNGKRNKSTRRIKGGY